MEPDLLQRETGEFIPDFFQQVQFKEFEFIRPGRTGNPDDQSLSEDFKREAFPVEGWADYLRPLVLEMRKRDRGFHSG